MRYAFGVDIGGTTVKLGLFDEDCNLLEKWEIPTITENKGKQIIPDVTKSILAKMEEKGIAKDEVLGVGLGAPGACDKNGMMTGGAVNLGWEPFNVREETAVLLGGIPVVPGNDANVAAFGEMIAGGGKGYEDVLAVTLGTGVGGGVVLGGQLLAGSTGAAGEIGHIHIEDNEEIACNCGHRGCLEQYASATGIARLARRRLEKDNAPSSLRDIPLAEISAKSVFDAVKAGDAVADEIAKEFGEYLGKGLANVAAVINPQVIVVGGGVSKAGEVLLSYIEPAFQKYVFGPCGHVKIVLAQLGNDAGIYGSAGMAIKGLKE